MPKSKKTIDESDDPKFKRVVQHFLKTPKPEKSKIEASKKIGKLNKGTATGQDDGRKT